MLQYPPQQQQQPDALASHSTPVMRLRDDPQPPTPNPPPSQPAQPATSTRQSRKRKSPPSSAPPQPPQQHPPPPGIHLGQMLPPPHALMPPGMGHPPMYQYAPPGYPQPPPPHPEGEPSQQALNGESPDHDSKSGGRQLSQSKRAEQNRKAQRAFRERRDQCVPVPHASPHLLLLRQFIPTYLSTLDGSRPSSPVPSCSTQRSRLPTRQTDAGKNAEPS